MSCCISRTRITTPVSPALIRIDADGDEVWASDCLDVVWDITVDGDGNIWCAGTRGYNSRQFASVNNHTFRRYNDRASVCKLSPSGELLGSWDLGGEMMAINWDGTRLLAGSCKGLPAAEYTLIRMGEPDEEEHIIDVLLDTVHRITLPAVFDWEDVDAAINQHPDILSGRYNQFTVTEVTGHERVYVSILAIDGKLTKTDRLYGVFHVMSTSGSGPQGKKASVSVDVIPYPVPPLNQAILVSYQSENWVPVYLNTEVGEEAGDGGAAAYVRRTHGEIFNISADGKYLSQNTKVGVTELEMENATTDFSGYPLRSAIDGEAETWSIMTAPSPGPGSLPTPYHYTVAIEGTSWGAWYPVYSSEYGGRVMAYDVENGIYAAKNPGRAWGTRTYVKPYFCVIGDVAYMPSNKIYGYEYEYLGIEETKDTYITEVFESDAVNVISGMINYNGNIRMIEDATTLSECNLSTGAITQVKTFTGAVIRCLRAIPESTDMLLGGAYF